jgi:hypothetical protein
VKIQNQHSQLVPDPRDPPRQTRLSRPEPGTLRSPSSWAFLAPIACALHCMAAPLLVVLAPALAPTPRLEWAFFLVSGGLAVGLLAWQAAPERRFALWALALVGLFVWAASIADWFHPVPETVTTVIGTFLVAGALFWNVRLRRRVSCDIPSTPSGDPGVWGDAAEPRPSRRPGGGSLRRPRLPPGIRPR